MDDSALQYSSDGQSLDPEVIVFNLKKRYTGVSATVNGLLPLQLKQWRLAYCGSNMSNGVAGMTLLQAIRLSRRPPTGRAFRIWHLRRDNEMLAAIFARDVLRLPIKLVFTSAAKHRHGRLPRWLISKMDAVIATTVGAALFVPNTSKIVAHGIDLQRFSPPENKATSWQETGLPGQYGIGVFGRVRYDKGTDVFVEAMLQALPQLPGATAVIAGWCQPKHQKFLQQLQERIAAYGLSERIVFLGEVPAAEVNLWHQRCLVCVACPRYEPFGLTPFEAAACGCAVICSKTGAFEDLVEPGINGAIVPTDDADALAQAVLQTLASQQQALEQGHSAREKVVNEFSLQQEAAGIGAVYQELWDATN